MASNQQMNMEIEVYISSQPADRQKILSDIHTAIIENDKSVIAKVGSMMGKEMIVYKGKGLNEIWACQCEKLYFIACNANIWFKSIALKVQTFYL